MSVRHDPATTRPWVNEGTALLLSVANGLADADLGAPSRLAGWSRAHVLGHLARNAEALGRLAAWARTGIETPMYGDAEQRAAEIEASARLAPDRLRRELAGTAEQLEDALDALDADRWGAQVRSALGRSIPAAEIPWMRVREVWLHAVDLDAGVETSAIPDGVVDTLLDDVVNALSTRDGCPAARLEPTDRERAWTLGPDGGPTVRGPANAILAWLTGRSAGADLDPDTTPAVPRWL